ncbi:MAG: signal recognition particle subunit SRP19/SEC65 family protein [Methanocorpusculum sp.]|nr:signal recognition particle subunit SRP19/SEC65 family protein [Methanocorpusculum sp.]
MAVRYLYPCYFDLSLTRKEGRRVNKDAAVENPNSAQISRAAKLAGLNVVEENKTAHHPAQWYKAGGRISIEYEGSKEQLLKTVAGKLGGK